VSGPRRQRILDQLVDTGPTPLGNDHLCGVCADVTGMTGAGIMVLSDDVAQVSICTTDPVSARIEDLQLLLGEGPCIDACHEDRPVLEPDLAGHGTSRWLGFTGPAVEAGALAVFGFPLRVGAIRLGALNLYRDSAGPLTDDQHADALVVADIAAQSVLVLQAEAPPGQLAAELAVGADLHLVVHQASGMVSAQLGVGVGEALVRLRAYAFGHDLPLTEVARSVVGRALRFVPPGDGIADQP
jgi:hypothetical protein